MQTAGLKNLRCFSDMEQFRSKPEHVEYIRSIAKGRYSNEIRDMFNEHFGTDLSLIQVLHIKKFHKITSGVHGSNSTGGQFKPGHACANAVSVGTVTLRKGTKDKNPYYWIKIGEPNQWEVLHKHIWEKENGKVPDNHVLYFIDGNTLNCKLDNLALMHRKTLVILNRMDKMTDDVELNKCIIAEAELSSKLYELGVRSINRWKLKG